MQILYVKCPPPSTYCSTVVPFFNVAISSITVAVIAGDTIIGKGRVKIVAPGRLDQFGQAPAQTGRFLNAAYNFFQNLPEALGHAIFSHDVVTPLQSTQLLTSGDANLGADPGAVWGSPSPRRPPALVPAQQSQSTRLNAGAGPNGPNPNAIVQGQDGIGEEYRQRLNAYNNQAILARQALQGYDPSKGPLPGAAQEARDQGLEIWKGLYAGTKMGQEGGAVGTFNPLMQARNDVPSMAELWQGIGGGAPTAGPSQDAINAAIARGINQPGSGGFFAPPGSPSPVEQAQQQQLDTAAQAGSGTEASTAMQRTEDFIKNIKFGALNPNNYSLPSTDYLKNFDWNADYSAAFK